MKTGKISSLVYWQSTITFEVNLYSLHIHNLVLSQVRFINISIIFIKIFFQQFISSKQQKFHVYGICTVQSKFETHSHSQLIHNLVLCQVRFISILITFIEIFSAQFISSKTQLFMHKAYIK